MGKKVLIINSSSFTVGDVAISSCMIDQIKKMIPDADISIESGNASDHKNYVVDKKISVVQRLFDTRSIVYSRSYLSFSFFKNNVKLVFQYLFDAFEMLIFAFFGKTFTKRQIFRLFKEADLVVSAGGDAITKHYGFFLRIYIFVLLKKMKKDVIVYASTIGPFSGISKWITISGLQKVDLILARDQKSYDFLRESGISDEKVKRTADCVILLEKLSTDKTQKIILDLSLNEKTIAIFLKANAFSDVLPEAYEKYLQNINSATVALQNLGYTVVLCAANHTDYQTTKDFLKKFNRNNFVINLMDYYAEEGKELLSKMGLVITSRMHPAILASTAGIPVIGISNETKMLEYLKIINIPELYLKQSDFEVETLLRLVTESIGESSIKEKLDTALIRAKELSGKNIQYMKEWLSA